MLIGFVGLFLCVLGAILPVLPSFPFALMAAFGFARSSEKLHDRFVASRLYQDNAKDWVEHRAMRPQAKKRVLMTISLVLLCSWLMLFHLPWVQWILVAVWIGHVLYFRFGIRTLED
nr:YbaN family protein [uncultured Allobaculum sp.]